MTILKREQHFLGRERLPMHGKNCLPDLCNVILNILMTIQIDVCINNNKFIVIIVCKFDKQFQSEKRIEILRKYFIICGCFCVIE